MRQRIMKWISVKDALPKQNEFVLVKMSRNSTRVYGSGGRRRMHNVVQFRKDDSGHNPNNNRWYKWHNEPCVYFGQDVTHWMRIPR